MATVTFSQMGVRPPVYIVSSMSNPPWQVLQMNAHEETEYGRVVFSYTFGGVRNGVYQYKIRVGDGQWVVDPTEETTIDNAGNENNVFRVKDDRVRIDQSEEDLHIASLTTLPPNNAAEHSTEERISHGMHIMENIHEGPSKAPEDLKPDGSQPDVSAITQYHTHSRQLEYQAASQPQGLPEVKTDKHSLNDASSEPFHPAKDREDEKESRSLHRREPVAAKPEIPTKGQSYHVEPGTEEEKAAPLLEHEIFNQGFNLGHNRSPSRGPMRSISERFPTPQEGGPMAPIKEESSGSSHTLTPDYATDDGPAISSELETNLLPHEASDAAGYEADTSVSGQGSDSSITERDTHEHYQRFPYRPTLQVDDMGVPLFPHECPPPHPNSSSSHRPARSQARRQISAEHSERLLEDQLNAGLIEEFPPDLPGILTLLEELRINHRRRSSYQLQNATADAHRVRPRNTTLHAVIEEQDAEDDNQPESVPFGEQSEADNIQVVRSRFSEHLPGNEAGDGHDGTRDSGSEWVSKVVKPLSTQTQGLEPLNRPNTPDKSAGSASNRDQYHVDSRRLEDIEARLQRLEAELQRERNLEPPKSEGGVRHFFSKVCCGGFSGSSAIFVASVALVAFYLFFYTDTQPTQQATLKTY